MRACNIPSGIGALGYQETDIPALAERTFAQQRLLKNAPCQVTLSDLQKLFADALDYSAAS